ncbi:hypothetical protein [Leptothermofonsia sp. ETS-13]|uniref:hypothetical protein n=1 Tax=Leptothermofonsia sp. ETS-13 TaxID=3035696 RepID=UPI003BA26A54
MPTDSHLGKSRCLVTFFCHPNEDAAIACHPPARVASNQPCIHPFLLETIC